MKLPNGYGSIVNLGKNRRKPYAVRITVGRHKNSNGNWTPTYKYLAYFEDRKTALNYLANYNSNNAVKEHVKLIEMPTFFEMYYEWLDYKNSMKNKLSPHSIYNYDIAFNRFTSLHDKKFVNITYQELQEVVTSCNDKSKTTVSAMRAILKGMYFLAKTKGLIDSDITTLIHYEWTNSTTKIHTRFTDDEIRILWKNCYHLHNVDSMLIAIYTGLRPIELCDMECANIYLNERYMIGGAKTEAGRNRIIPICDRIYPLIKTRYKEGKKYLISNKFGNHYTTGVYYDSFVNSVKKLGMKHNPHDCRYTFASLADNVCMNDVCLKKIMGHSISDITKGVYTDKTTEELLVEVQKLNDLF